MSRRSARLVKDEPDGNVPSLPSAFSSSSNAPKAVTKKRTSNQVKADVKTGPDGKPLPIPRAPSSHDDPKPSGKRRKVTPEDAKVSEPPAKLVKAKGRRRGLKMIAEMPVDILLEIFQHLDPADLLSLSRTDRTLRAYVMKRSVALAWWNAVSTLP